MFPNPLSKGFHCFIATQGLTLLNILRYEFFEGKSRKSRAGLNLNVFATLQHVDLKLSIATSPEFRNAQSFVGT